MVNHNGTGILCDCCEHKLMAVLKPCEGLEIRDDRHFVMVPPGELLARLAGTMGNQGIMDFVKTVIGG